MLSLADAAWKEAPCVPLKPCRCPPGAQSVHAALCIPQKLHKNAPMELYSDVDAMVATDSLRDVQVPPAKRG